MYSKAFSPVGVIAGSYALCVLASQIDVPAVTSLGFDCARMPGMKTYEPHYLKKISDLS